MTAIEIRLDGSVIDKAAAAAHLARPYGHPVQVSAPGHGRIEVQPRYFAFGDLNGPVVNWASGSGTTGGTREWMEVLAAAVELAEMAEGLTPDGKPRAAAAGDGDLICATPGCGHRERHHLGRPNQYGRRPCTGETTPHTMAVSCKCGDFTPAAIASAPKGA